MTPLSSGRFARGGRVRNLGFTLLENVFACALISLGLAGTYTLNGQTMGILRMAKDEACASQVMQQRIEHLRIANWQRITSATWIKDHLLNVVADGGSDLKNLTETVTLTPFDGSNPVNSFNRLPNGSVTTGTNASLINQDAVILKWKVSWTGVPANKLHHRESLVVLAKGGIAK